LNDPRVIIEAPTRWAKSEICTVTKPLVDAIGGRKENIMLISNTGALAEEKLGLIKQELETNKNLKSEFGIRRGRKWANDEIIVHSKYGTCRILSKGFGYQIRGWGFDEIVPDDLESKEMIQSEVQREKFKEWFLSDLLGRAEPGCQIIWVGTFLGQLCFLRKAYFDLVPGFQHWKKILITALDEAGKSTWEDRWSTAVLEQQRIEMGHRAFSAEKMGKPLGSENQVFQEDWIKYYTEPPKAPLAIVQGIDPNQKKGDIANYFAITTWAKDINDNYYLLPEGWNRGKWGMNDGIRASVAMDKKFKPRYWKMESPVKDNMDWRESIKREADNQHTFVTVRFIKPHADKVSRAYHVTPLFEQNKVFFPENPKVQPVIDELLEFPDGEFDDYVDAMVYALDALKGERVGPVKPFNIKPMPQLKPDPISGRLK